MKFIIIIFKVHAALSPEFSWTVSCLLGSTHAWSFNNHPMFCGFQPRQAVTSHVCTWPASLIGGQVWVHTPENPLGRTHPLPMMWLLEKRRQRHYPLNSPPSAPIHLPDPWSRDSFSKLNHFFEADRIWSTSHISLLGEELSVLPRKSKSGNLLSESNL